MAGLKDIVIALDQCFSGGMQVTAKNVAALLGGSRSYVAATLGALVRNGSLIKVGGGVNTSYEKPGHIETYETELLKGHFERLFSRGKPKTPHEPEGIEIDPIEVLSQLTPESLTELISVMILGYKADCEYLKGELNKATLTNNNLVSTIEKVRAELKRERQNLMQLQTDYNQLQSRRVVPEPSVKRLLLKTNSQPAPAHSGGSQSKRQTVIVHARPKHQSHLSNNVIDALKDKRK